MQFILSESDAQKLVDSTSWNRVLKCSVWRDPGSHSCYCQRWIVPTILCLPCEGPSGSFEVIPHLSATFHLCWPKLHRNTKAQPLLQPPDNRIHTMWVSRGSQEWSNPQEMSPRCPKRKICKCQEHSALVPYTASPSIFPVHLRFLLWKLADTRSYCELSQDKKADTDNAG